MTLQRSHLLATLAGAALVLAACGSSSPSADSSPTGDSSPDTVASTDVQSTEAPADESSLDARCAIERDDGGFDEIGCEQPHDSEFVGVVAAPSGDAPTDEDAQALQLAALCAPLAEDVVSLQTFPMALEVRPLVSSAPGEPYEGDVECWVFVPLAEAFTASIAETDLSTAIDGYVLFEDLDVGDCFFQPDFEAASIGISVACTDDDAELLFGIAAADEGDYPGADALIDEASAKCITSVPADLESSIDLDEAFVTRPEEVGWTVFGQRKIFCSVPMAGIDLGGATDSDPGEADSAPVDIDPPEGFVFGEGDPICAIDLKDPDIDILWAEAECGEPHNGELVALVGPPNGTIPADSAEASTFFNAICLPFVEDATGADLFRPGVGIGFSVPGELGGEYEGQVECYASFPSLVLVGSFQDGPLEEIIGDQVIIADLSPGECFIFAEDSFGSGDQVSCSEPEALMFVGTFQAADRPYPGTDELRLERDERCPEVLVESGLVASGLAGDSSTLSGTFPDEAQWIVPGQRLVTCDIEPA